MSRLDFWQKQLTYLRSKLSQATDSHERKSLEDGIREAELEIQEIQSQSNAMAHRVDSMTRDKVIERMTHEISKEEAIEISESGAYKALGMAEFAVLQLCQPKLCCPDFSYFHGCVEFLLGRPILKHEFTNGDALYAEAMKLKPTPSLQQIIDMLPKNKTIVVQSNED